MPERAGGSFDTSARSPTACGTPRWAAIRRPPGDYVTQKQAVVKQLIDEARVGRATERSGIPLRHMIGVPIRQRNAGDPAGGSEVGRV